MLAPAAKWLLSIYLFLIPFALRWSYHTTVDAFTPCNFR